MDKKLKAKWVKALRSGDYKQCHGFLYEGGGYCCLGVLQHVITGKQPPARWESNGVPVEMHFLRQDERRLEIQLANMNDGKFQFQRSHSFAEIADWIEKNIPATRAR